MKENNIEGGWEDSYQKRDRLYLELKATIDEVRHFCELIKKDKESLDKFKTEMDAVDELLRLNELKQKELQWEHDRLDREYKRIRDLEEVDEKELDRIMAGTAENSKRILDCYEEMADIYGKSDKILENFAAVLGDSEGSNAILTSKIEKIENIRRQIREIDENA
ncbi:TPA: hypothetical protein DCQ44_01975 [Candidatus Taylorbacteria bacterium]|nr:hypothetical protein [Candidatus Taylorbacteria bacterium]